MVSSGQGLLSNNMFAYCGNNPINRVDSSGQFWKCIGQFFDNVWTGIKTWAQNTFGASASTTATIYETETPIIPDPLPITLTNSTETTQTVTDIGDSTKFISVYADGNLNDPLTSTAGLKINIDEFTLDLSLGLDDIGVKCVLGNGNIENSFGAKMDLSRLKVGFEISSAVTWDATTYTDSTNASISGWAIVFAYYFLTTGQLIPSPANN